MEFLVHFDTSRVYALPAAERDDLINRQQERGRELVSKGTIRHLWDLAPAGQQGGVGIWAAEDADGLEAVLTSLPIRPYIDIEVTPLAIHPLMAQVS
jgi:muconolactone D-isomerase